MKDFMDYVGWFISTGLLLLVIYVIKKIPDMVSDKLKNVREHEFNKELQVDEYYRKDGNLQEIMMNWTKYAVDNDSLEKVSTPKGKKELFELVQKTIGYGSDKTVKLLTKMFQGSYQNSIAEESTSENVNGESPNEAAFETMVTLAMIVSSLKEDFTGQKIDPLDVLKIKINDFNKHEALFKKIVTKINDELGVKV